MRFFSLRDRITPIRNQPSQRVSVQESEVADTGKLTEIIRRLSQRVSALEATATPTSVEYEVSIVSGTDLLLPHNFGGPVRWWVTYWATPPGGTPPVQAPILVASDDSTPNVLILKTYMTGLAVIRIERSQSSLSV